MATWSLPAQGQPTSERQLLGELLQGGRQTWGSPYEAPEGLWMWGADLEGPTWLQPSGAVCRSHGHQPPCRGQPTPDYHC